MEKLIIHTIQITKKQEKQLFQIVLPENTEAITGVGVTCDQFMINQIGFSKIERQAGTLQLFAADTGEHIFSDNPHTVYKPTDFQKFDQILFARQIWIYKTHFGMLNTWQRVTSTLIDGFYRDEVGTVLDSVNYKVRIYLRLKLL